MLMRKRLSNFMQIIWCLSSVQERQTSQLPRRNIINLGYPLIVFYVTGLYFIWYYYESVAKEQESQLKKEATQRLDNISQKVDSLDAELTEGQLNKNFGSEYETYIYSLSNYKKVSQKHAELCEKLEEARTDNEILYRTLTRLSATLQLQKKM